MHILFLLQTGFSLWMLMDAIRRGAPQLWWLVVLVPFGEWAYFFAVYLPDKGYGELLKRKLFTKPITIEELRRDRRQTPSHENLVRLAQGLHDHGHYREAAELFAEVIDAHAEDKDALYGYACCALEEGERAAQIDALERLIEFDISFADFQACMDLAKAYWSDDRRDDAIAAMQKLCKKSQRIGPRVVLADYLSAVDRHSEARSLLVDGLDTYDSSPRFVRRRDRRQARAARAVLSKLPAE